MYIISPLKSQLRTASRKVAIKYIGPLVAYKIIDPYNYLLMTLDGKLWRGLFEHERLKPAMIRTDQRNMSNLAHLRASNNSWHVCTMIDLEWMLRFIAVMIHLINLNKGVNRVDPTKQQLHN